MKNLNFVRKFALIIIFLISVFLFFLFWNKQSSSKEIKNPMKIESTSIVRKLLIVTESSPFKDLIIAELLDYYKSPQILVEIVDGKTMANTDAAILTLSLFYIDGKLAPHPEMCDCLWRKTRLLKIK